MDPVLTIELNRWIGDPVFCVSIFLSLSYVKLTTFAKDQKFLVVDLQWTRKNNGGLDLDPVLTIELNRWIGVPVFCVFIF